jgi:hypothetical protein
MTRRAKAGASDTARDTPLAVMLPASIVRAVKIRAAESGQTLRETVLRALKADGFKVPDWEIADRRAAANKERGQLRKKPGGI